MNPRIFFQLAIFFALIIIATTDVWAQPGLPDAPSQAPIDGGLSILAAAGGAYALKKLKNRKLGDKEMGE